MPLYGVNVHKLIAELSEVQQGQAIKILEENQLCFDI